MAFLEKVFGEELYLLMQERFKPQANKASLEQKRVAAATRILELLDAELTGKAGESLVFEADHDMLLEVVEAIERESITEKYDVVQISETEFRVTPKVFDLRFDLDEW